MMARCRCGVSYELTVNDDHSVGRASHQGPANPSKQSVWCLQEFHCLDPPKPGGFIHRTEAYDIAAKLEYDKGNAVV